MQLALVLMGAGLELCGLALVLLGRPEKTALSTRNIGALLCVVGIAVAIFGFALKKPMTQSAVYGTSKTSPAPTSTKP